MSAPSLPMANLRDFVTISKPAVSMTAGIVKSHLGGSLPSLLCADHPQIEVCRNLQPRGQQVCKARPRLCSMRQATATSHHPSAFFSTMTASSSSFDRRRFLAATGMASLSLLTPHPAQAAFKTVIKKAKIIKDIDETLLRELHAAGFDGVEVSRIFDDETEARKARELIEGIGLKVHSVLRGWAEFNSDDPGQVSASYVQTEKALQTAHWLGAETILLVPCRVGGIGIVMPQPWEFDIEFDDKT
eukprot:gene52151-63750_t